jgi:hypothetical protein
MRVIIDRPDGIDRLRDARINIGGAAAACVPVVMVRATGCRKRCARRDSRPGPHRCHAIFALRIVSMESFSVNCAD